MSVYNFSTLKWGVEGVLFFEAHPYSASDNGCSCLGYFLLNEPGTGSSASRLLPGVEAWSGSSFPCPLPPWREGCGLLWARSQPAGGQVGAGRDILGAQQQDWGRWQISIFWCEVLGLYGSKSKTYDGVVFRIPWLMELIRLDYCAFRFDLGSLWKIFFFPKHTLNLVS